MRQLVVADDEDDRNFPRVLEIVARVAGVATRGAAS
jgi:hypothetical protein